MSWKDRIQAAAYVTPSGVRFYFDYENLSEAFTKKGTAFERIEADGTYIQQLGKSSRRVPLVIIFHGENCDITATEFMRALGEPGIGRLEHPLYGNINVVPLGDIERTDSLVRRANEVKISVTFWETIEEVFISVKEDYDASIYSSLDELYDISSAIGDEMLEEIEENAEELTSLENFLLETADDIESALKPVVDVIGDATEAIKTVQSRVGDVQSRFNAIADAVRTSAAQLETATGSIISQTMRMVTAPAEAFATLKYKVSAYQSFITTKINRFNAVYGIDSAGVFIGREQRKASSAFTVTDTATLAAVSAIALSATSSVTTSDTVVSSDGEIHLQTRTDAIEAAETLLSVFDDLVEWREANQGNLSIVDTGGLYQAAYNVVIKGAAALIQLAFTLRQERTIVLDRDRTIVDLEYELYGTVDDNLDFILATNSLTGSEILELPRGKRIKYYV